MKSTDKTKEHKLVRPMLRYHGGKWKLAPWIISHLPEHRVYVEPFGGAASVLLKKDRSHAEIYNDMDSDVVNLFRVVRDQGDALRRQLELTPYARQEFDLAWQPCEDPLERARRTVIRSALGRSSASVTSGYKSSFRVYLGDKRPATTVTDWINYPKALDALIERLRGVVIENRDALKVMSMYDGPDTLHYVDPPYMPSLRDVSGKDYRFEMTHQDHERLLVFLQSLKGRVVLSGYACALYDDALLGWNRIAKRTYADNAREREEVLWLSPNCCDQTLLLEPDAGVFDSADEFTQKEQLLLI